jgi:hypothetical protein
LKKLINENEEDNDTKFIMNKFNDEEDFISFEDENEKNENVSFAKNAKHAKHDNLRTNHLINDEFNSKNFFNNMNDERAFETLYN